jgi:hypothetical protein
MIGLLSWDRLLAVTMERLRLTLIPQLVCQRVRMVHQTANVTDIASIMDIFQPCRSFGKVKNNFLYPA